MLFSELKNLHHGNMLVKDFFDYAEELEVSISRKHPASRLAKN